MAEKNMMQSDILKRANPISNELPKIERPVTSSILSLENKSFLFTLKLAGIPFESVEDHHVELNFDGLTKVLSTAAKDKSSRLAIWTTLSRRQTQFKSNYSFTNSFMQNFSEKYLARFNSGKFYENHFFMTFILKYDNYDDGLDEIKELENFMFNSLSPYDPELLRTYFYDNGEKSFDIKNIGNNILFSETYNFIASLFNYSEIEIPVNQIPFYETAPDSHLHFGYDILEIRTNSAETRYATCYDLKDYPEVSYSGLFNCVLEAKSELLLTQSFICMNPYETIKEINSQVNKLESAGDEATHQIDEMNNAKGYISSGELAFGEYHAALVVFSSTPKKSIDNGVALTSAFLTRGGARWIKATLSAPFTYFSQVPANFKARPRMFPKSTRNLASSFTMHNYSSGKSKGNPIGDGSAIVPLQTRQGAIYHYNFHYTNPEQDNLGEKVAGHTLILGATGTGKTTLQCFLLGFLERFKPKMFCIDYNRGMDVFIRAVGGTYFELTVGTDTGINPFQFEATKENIEFCYSLVESCGKDENGKLTATESKQIKFAVDSVFSLDFHLRRFSSLLQSIPFGELRTRLSEWTYAEDGRYAWALDSESNKFDPNNFNRIGFDVTQVMKVNFKPTEPVLATLFHMKEMMQKDGKLLVTVVEEFWMPANFPTTQEKIMKALKAGRLLGEFIILVSQSPEDAINCQIFPAIVQQTPTKVFLPNPDATFDSYRKCSLNKKEFTELAKLEKTSRTFLIKQGHQSSFCLLNLYGFGDELAVISATKENVTLLETIRAEVGEDPEVWLPIYQQRRSGAQNKTE